MLLCEFCEIFTNKIFIEYLFVIASENYFLLTHSAREYFEKLAFKKKTKNSALNGCISKARANSELKLIFSESSFNFLQNRVVFCTLYPRGHTAGGFAPYKPRCRCQQLAGLKELILIE